jgi:protoporphyrinogen oxidase
MTQRTAIIIGAGPAGLTAALEFLETTGIRPVVLEAGDAVGGIARSHNFRGNRMDLGGHRFFSKSEKVTAWWLRLLPLQGSPAYDDLRLGRKSPAPLARGGPDPEKTDRVMLLRNRFSRIYFQNKLFGYPVMPILETIRNLGTENTLKVLLGYAKARLNPVHPVLSLEDYMVNCFGEELYRIFFKDYTAKVWGVPPSQIKSDWGQQRIKGVSVSRMLVHGIRKSLRLPRLNREEVETSLIERFMYPKLGCGQIWEEAADRIRAKHGQILLNCTVCGIHASSDGSVRSVRFMDRKTGRVQALDADYVLSSMPVRDLVSAFRPAAPPEIKRIANDLVYRDFVAVGLLTRKLALRNNTKIRTLGGIIPDLWLYVQEKRVRVGRIQIYNNWSPYMLADVDRTVWLGLEYFCNEGDEIWSMDDGRFISLAAAELADLGIAGISDVVDGCVVRVPKAYPAYFGAYDRFGEIRGFLDRFPNLFPIGRNGMHRYNNMDHSMLTAMEAVKAIAEGRTGKDGLWAVNTERQYLEERTD